MVTSMPLVIGIGLFFVTILSYGQGPVVGPGLSPGTILLLAEVVAVAGETVLLVFLLPAHLNLGRALIASVLMNASSFLVGWLVFGGT